MQRHAPFRGRKIPVVTKSEFRKTGFTEAHLRGGRLEGWRAVSSLVEQCRRLVVAGEPFVYAYYPGIDEVAHAHGLEDGFFDAEVRFVDRLVGDLLAVLPADTALLVTADHGQVHLTPESWLDLGELAEVVDVCSGDGRFRYLHACRGAAEELVAGARARFGSCAWVRSRDELLADGWLGPEPPTVVRRRLGDVVLAARDAVAFVDPDATTRDQAPLGPRLADRGGDGGPAPGRTGDRAARSTR